jgi:hypothetical protein
MFSWRNSAAGFAIAIVACSAVTDAVQAADPPSKVWERHPGSASGDSVATLAADAAGNVIVAGVTLGSIGKPNEGGEDIFIIKYSSAGEVLWRRQKGSPKSDRVESVATDPNGNITAVGYTNGWLFGRKAGQWDAFVISYSADGAVRWKHQLGTDTSDFARAVVADAAGNVIVGATLESDCVLIKYEADGSETWRRLVRSGRTEFTGITLAPGGTLVVAGSTGGFEAPTGQDVFLAAYSPEGDLLWFQQFRTDGTDYGGEVAVAADGTIYLVGSEAGALPSTTRAFLATYSPTGDPLWKRTFGGENFDIGIGVAVDAAGNVVITGQKARQQFAASYTRGGTLRWTTILETSPDYRLHPVFDEADNLFLAGTIEASDARHADGYLAKFSD